MAHEVFHASLWVRKLNQLFTVMSRIMSGGVQCSVSVRNLHICAKCNLNVKIMFKIMFEFKVCLSMCDLFVTTRH